MGPRGSSRARSLGARVGHDIGRALSGKWAFEEKVLEKKTQEKILLAGGWKEKG